MDGFISRLKENFLKKIFPDRILSMLGQNFEQDKHPLPMTWFYNPKFGIPRDANLTLLRQLSKTAWVRMCIDTIIEEICSFDWDIIPKEEYKDNYNEEIKQKIIEFFKYPNPDDDFYSMLRKLLEDILVLDAGVLVKVFSSTNKTKSVKVYENIYKDGKLVGKKPTEIRIKKLTSMEDLWNVPSSYKKGDSNSEMIMLRPADGATFLKQPLPNGLLPIDSPAYFQYSFIHPNASPIPFYKREVVYFSMNPRTNSFYGFSPLQSLVNILEALTNSVRFNKAIFDEYALPNAIISFEDMDKDTIKAISREWQKELKGKPHKILFTSNKMDIKTLQLTAKDMEWLDGQKFYMKIVFALFHVNQGELGFTDELNKHSSEVQSRILFRKMIYPLINLIEHKFNNEIIPEFYLTKGLDIETEFKFIIEDKEEKAKEIMMDLSLVQNGILTPNEVRTKWGYEPLPDGDFLKGNFSFFAPKEEYKEETNKQLKKKFNKKVETFEEEYKDYNEFLTKYYNFLKNKTIQTLTDKQFGILNKSWNDFFSILIHLFNPESIKEHIRKAVKKTFVKGIEKGENETGIQVGFQDKFNPRIEELTMEQIDGYTLPDGKRWFGIRGVNEELRKKIIQEIKLGMELGESTKEISNRIKSVFDNIEDFRSMVIARTETTRIANMGSLQAYINSGLKGKKQWVSKIDDRTSEICRYLNGQKVDLELPFIGPNGEKYYHPPAHPLCRSSIIFIPESD